MSSAHRSHVLPGLGTPRCEFHQVDDLADAELYLLHFYDAEPIANIGSGEDVTIRELIDVVVGDWLQGAIGILTLANRVAPRRLLDVTRQTNLDWGSRNVPPTRDSRESTRLLLAR